MAAVVSFKDMTTRRHYPGHHRIDALINGIAHPLAEFQVLRNLQRSRSAKPLRD